MSHVVSYCLMKIAGAMEHMFPRNETHAGMEEATGGEGAHAEKRAA